MQRRHAYEILVAALGLLLLLAPGLGLGSATATPPSAHDDRPAHTGLVGEPSQEHAVARPGAATQPVVKKLLTVLPSGDDAAGDEASITAADAVPHVHPAPGPQVRLVRAPPAGSAI